MGTISFNTWIYDKRQACYYCKKLYLKIARHYQTVRAKDGEKDKGEEHKYKDFQQWSKLLLLSQKPSQCNLLNENIVSMKSHEITIIIAFWNDDLIFKHGTHLAQKVDGEWLHEVSQGMRHLARLLLYLREKSSSGHPVIGLEHFMKAEHFGLIIASIKSLSSFDQSGKTGTVGISSLTLMLGHSLRKCAAILTGKALRWKHNILLTEQNLEKLIASERNEHISHRSFSMLQSKKFNKIKTTACNQWFGNFKEVPPGPTVSVNKIFTRGYWHMCLEGVSRDDPCPSHNL